MIALLNNFVNVNQFRIRGRGRARGVFAGTNTGPNNSNTTFQKRPKEEEWDPEYTPKSKKYFLVGVRNLFYLVCVDFQNILGEYISVRMFTIMGFHCNLGEIFSLNTIFKLFEALSLDVGPFSSDYMLHLTLNTAG